MSLDKSLKVKNALARHRNVLTRAERVEKMISEERWEEGKGVLGLPKTRVIRLMAKKHKAAKAAEEEAATGAAEEAATQDKAEE